MINQAAAAKREPEQTVQDAADSDAVRTVKGARERGGKSPYADAEASLMAALKQINPHADEASVDAMLTLADADGDVRVSFDEFKEIICGKPKAADEKEEGTDTPLAQLSPTMPRRRVAMQGVARRVSRDFVGLTPAGRGRQRGMSRDALSFVASSTSFKRGPGEDTDLEGGAHGEGKAE